MSSSPAAAATLTQSPGASTGNGRRSSRAGTNGSKRKGIVNAGPNPSPDNSGSDEELESIIPAGADISGIAEAGGRKTRSSSTTPTNGPNPVVTNPAGYPKRTCKRENSTHSNHSTDSREPSSVQGGDGCQLRRSRSRERSRSGNRSSVGTIEPLFPETIKENEKDSTKTNGEPPEDIKTTRQTTSTPNRTTRATRMSSLEENGNNRSSKEEEEDMDISPPANSNNSLNDNKSNSSNNRKANNLQKSRGKRKSSAANSENSDSENGDECPSETIQVKLPSSNAKETDSDDKTISIITNSEVAVPTPPERNILTADPSPSGELNGPIMTQVVKKPGRGRPRKHAKKIDASIISDKPKNFEEFKHQVETNLR